MLTEWLPKIHIFSWGKITLMNQAKLYIDLDLWIENDLDGSSNCYISNAKNNLQRKSILMTLQVRASHLEFKKNIYIRSVKCCLQRRLMHVCRSFERHKHWKTIYHSSKVEIRAPKRYFHFWIAMATQQCFVMLESLFANNQSTNQQKMNEQTKVTYLNKRCCKSIWLQYLFGFNKICNITIWISSSPPHPSTLYQ